jgi:hypothetical protein
MILFWQRLGALLDVSDGAAAARSSCVCRFCMAGVLKRAYDKCSLEPASFTGRPRRLRRRSSNWLVCVKA